MRKSCYHPTSHTVKIRCHVSRALVEQDKRFGCEFGTFFSCPDGATPTELLHKGIYSEIAVPLKGGAWRQVPPHLCKTQLHFGRVPSLHLATKFGDASRVAVPGVNGAARCGTPE